MGEKGRALSLQVSPVSPKEPELSLCFILFLVKVKFRRMLAKVRSMLRNTWDGSGGWGRHMLATVLRRMLKRY